MDNKSFLINSGSKIALLLSNFVPIFGVVFLNWDVNSIIFLYWLETLVILTFSIIKIKKAQGDPSLDQQANVTINGISINRLNKKILVKLSIINNGIFILIYLGIIIAIFGLPKISLYSVYITLLSMIISHYVSYKINYIGKEEFLKISPSRVYLIPESRMWIISIVAMFGGLFAKMTGGNTVALILMIILKTSADLYSHVKEHKYLKVVSMTISSNLYRIKESDLIK